MDINDNNDVLRFSSASEAAECLTRCALSARRTLEIFSDHLTPGLYSNEAFVDAVSALARSGSQAKIRILLRDSRPLHGTRHALVMLSQRLPSHIQLLTLTEDIAPPGIAYAIADATSVVYFNNESDTEGFLCHQAKPEAKNLLETFQPMWQGNTKEDPNLRKLSTL